jgi:GntR family transcriptional regulator
MRSIGLEVDQVVEELSVRRCLLAEAAALAIPAGSAVINIERTHLSGGRPLETADIVVPADKYRLVYRFSVPGGPT